MNAWVSRCVVLCLTAVAAATARGLAAGATTQPAATQPTTRPVAKGAPGSLDANLRRLRRENLTPPESTTSAELQRMIEELRSIRVSPRRRGKVPLAASAVPSPTSRPAATTGPARGAGSGSPATSQPARAARRLPKKVLEALKALPASSLSQPVEVADELYRSGYLGAAFTLYERALKDVSDADVRSWSLYQMANCRRGDAVAEAETLYGRVLSEYPQTLWAQPAATERKLLQWTRVNRPAELLKAVELIGRERPSPATTRPATTRPATTQPATTQPATTQPATTQPATTQPAAGGKA